MLLCSNCKRVVVILVVGLLISCEKTELEISQEKNKTLKDKVVLLEGQVKFYQENYIKKPTPLKAKFFDGNCQDDSLSCKLLNQCDC